MVKVYIDGREGTTGLKIYERMAERKDVQLITISDELRKDSNERKRCINASDITFLCLPDSASIEAVSFVEGNTRIIDASTAHRVNPDWAYGFPELGDDFRRKIEKSDRVAVPGCHASGFLSIVYPLVKLGIVPVDYPIVCHSISGYSGAGKKAISQYNDENRSIDLDSPRQYAMAQTHKHLPEMQLIPGLAYKPIFTPIIADFYSGMEVTVPFYTRLLNGKQTVESVYEALKNYYSGQRMIEVKKNFGDDIQNFMPANQLSGKNTMTITVHGNDERVVVTSIFDNLGKGASGAAMQCMNVMLGLPEDSYL